MTTLTPSQIKISLRRDVSRRQRLTYGDIHGINPFTGQMSPLGPIPVGKMECDVSAIVTYEQAEEIEAEIVSLDKAWNRGDVFIFEGREWLITFSETHSVGRYMTNSKIVAEWRQALDPSHIAKP